MQVVVTTQLDGSVTSSTLGFFLRSSPQSAWIQGQHKTSQHLRWCVKCCSSFIWWYTSFFYAFPLLLYSSFSFFQSREQKEEEEEEDQWVDGGGCSCRTCCFSWPHEWAGPTWLPQRTHLCVAILSSISWVSEMCDGSSSAETILLLSLPITAYFYFCKDLHLQICITNAQAISHNCLFSFLHYPPLDTHIQTRSSPLSVFWIKSFLCFDPLFACSWLNSILVLVLRDPGLQVIT